MPVTVLKTKSTESSSTNKFPRYQIISTFTFCVISGTFFILLTEICIAQYIYRLIKSEINEGFIAKRDFNDEFINAIRRGIAKEEIRKILSELDFGDYENARTNTTLRKKRNSFVVNNGNFLNSPNHGPSVEFFDPKLRSDLEEKDAIEREKSGNKVEDPWVWLTSYCRIPVSKLDLLFICKTCKLYNSSF